MNLQHENRLGRLAFITACLVLALSAALPSVAAVCLSSGKPCGASMPSNDRLCCPGSICGPWGNVCQAGCRIAGVAYRAGTVNPTSPCQVCQPNLSTTAWSRASNGSSCDDGNRCNGISTCVSGACTQTTAPVTCPAHDACHAAGTCAPATGQCSNPALPGGTDCDDGNLCNGIDTCASGACIDTTPPVTCSALDDCHVAGTCEPSTGQCSNPQAPDGTSCESGVPFNGTCQAGTCVCASPGTPCEFGNPGACCSGACSLVGGGGQPACL